MCSVFTFTLLIFLLTSLPFFALNAYKSVRASFVHFDPCYSLPIFMNIFFILGIVMLYLILVSYVVSECRVNHIGRWTKAQVM